jgi:hypothetical protein
MKWRPFNRGHDHTGECRAWRTVDVVVAVSQRSRLYGALSACALLVTTLTAGCGGDTTSPHPTKPALPAEFAAVFGGEYNSVRANVQLDPHSSILIGPHSSIQLDQVAQTSALSEAQSQNLFPPHDLYLFPPFVAALGHELVLAHLVKTPDEGVGQPMLPLDHDEPRDSGPMLVVDGKQRKLYPGLQNNSTVVVSVPTGAPVLLRMTDGGRPQDIDLRTGKRVNGVPEYYPVLSADLANLAGLMAVGPDDSAYPLGAGPGIVQLEPYADSLGWAQPGRSWLVVWIRIGMNLFPYDFAAASDDVVLKLSDGSTPTPRETGTGPPYSSMAVRSTAVWALYDLPSSVRSGTVIFHLSGTFSDDGKPVAVRVDRRFDPGPQRRSFTLAPRKPNAGT